ncbi:T6SS phospholipase effector Tle1-like catalytic domain-containing protein [Cupriavidus plantarum]|uniref:T6SS phospholipase effector Tle1-like catalytic domain-containing protein n=1 Tax=Cupriavidus plantarum TaxID=942865 RepID=UPI00339D7283
MTTSTEAKKVAPLNQPLTNLASGADAASINTPGVASPGKPKQPNASAAAAGVNEQAQQKPPAPCPQCVTVSFFFDGTGNNLDADTPTGEHSNVARLYRSHYADDDIKHIYRRYIPGIGTYFRDIGDPGGKTTGNGMGALGQARLDWAFKELANLLIKAEARANNPSNKIVKLRIAIFGFSRGAALARAFARDLQKSCTGTRGSFKVRAGALGTSGKMVKGGYPIEVYFMGVFDTVASVGLPMSTNNAPVNRRHGASWRSALAFPFGGTQADADLKTLAFGEPGADPSPGPADGHGAWGDGLRIADVVTQCMHMASGHEMRNSFPLDSALDGNAYPSGTSEMVLPGVHSDVGGGYREGEGGKSSVLAAVPLRMMLERAVAAGVPMRSLAEMASQDELADFALDEQGRKRYDGLVPLFNSYMALIPQKMPLGKTVLAHMKQYWRYRFSAAVRRSAGTNATQEQKRIQQNEAAFAKDRAGLSAAAKQKAGDYYRVQAQRADAESALSAAQSSSAYGNQADMWRGMVNDLKKKEEAAHDAWRRAQARVDGAANDGDLLDNIKDYDAWLLEDGKSLYEWHKAEPSKRMRPHYQAIVEAYTEVVVNGRVLAESSELYQFFSVYVHDSLSGFALDNTRTTDPRVLYIGDDTKEKYAAVDRDKQPMGVGEDNQAAQMA